MSEVKSTYEIKFPSETTYFIAYTNTEIFGYGIVTPEQEMTTGQPYLYQTTNREEWVQTLINDFNTNPDETTNNL
jgi:hypothetical protein